MTQPNYLLNTDNFSYLSNTITKLTKSLTDSHISTESLLQTTQAFSLELDHNEDALEGFLNNKYSLHQIELPTANQSQHPDPYIRSLQEQNVKLQMKIRDTHSFNNEMVLVIRSYEVALNQLIGLLREEITSYHLQVIDNTRKQAEQLEQLESVYYEKQNQYSQLTDFLVQLSAKVRSTFVMLDKDEFAVVSARLDELDGLRLYFQAQSSAGSRE